MDNDKKKNEDKTLSEMRNEVIKNNFAWALNMLLGVVAGLLLRICLMAWSVQLLWNRFIVSSFDAQHISWTQGLVLTIFIAFFKDDYTRWQTTELLLKLEKEQGTHDPIMTTLKSTLHAVLVLVIVWLVVTIF